MDKVEFKKEVEKNHVLIIIMLIMMLLFSMIGGCSNDEIVAPVKSESKSYGITYTDTTGYKLKTYCIDGVKYVYRGNNSGQFFSVMFNKDSTVKVCE